AGSGVVVDQQPSDPDAVAALVVGTGRHYEGSRVRIASQQLGSIGASGIDNQPVAFEWSALDCQAISFCHFCRRQQHDRIAYCMSTLHTISSLPKPTAYAPQAATMPDAMRQAG